MSLASSASLPELSASKSPQAARLRLDYLDGLRGLAALYVVLHHAYYGLTLEATLPSTVAHLTYWLFLGRSAVDIFIVLSGYCLMMPVVRAGTGLLPGGAFDFVRRRARRILPPFYAALLLSLVFIALVPALHSAPANSLWATALPAFNPGVLLSHVLLIHNFNPHWHSKIDYPMWSVATEWQIYFLFPLLLLPVRRRAGLWIMLLTAFVVGLVPLALFFGRFSGVAPQFLGLFALGMVGAELNFSPNSGLITWREKLPWGLLALGLAALLGILSLRHSDWFLFLAVKDIVVGAMTGCLLVFCTRHLTRAHAAQDGRADSHFSARPAPRVLRLFESRAAVGLGAFSYSLYLVHAPILAVCLSALRPLHLSSTTTLALMLGIAVPLAVVGSYVFHLAFERPFLTRRAALDPATGRVRWYAPWRGSQETPPPLEPVSGKPNCL